MMTRPGYGDETPIGRTGFVTEREPTAGEAAFMEAAALYAKHAIITEGTNGVHRQVVAMIDRYMLGDIRGRTLARCREALPEGYFREGWDRQTETAERFAGKP
jgi:hypothetical protein